MLIKSVYLEYICYLLIRRQILFFIFYLIIILTIIQIIIIIIHTYILYQTLLKLKIKYKFNVTTVTYRILWWSVVFNKYKQLFIHLKDENFHLHSNNKVSIAVESREVLLDPSLFPDHCP